MSKNWDFYACRVDDEPASIFVDLGIAREAPLAGSPQMGYVLVEMNAPRPDGLSSQAEFEALAAIEDKLEAELCRAPGTIYVGRSTSAGRRDFFFYTAADDRWQDRVVAVMQSFPGYDFECGARADEEWQTYFGFLHPSPLDHHRISNRRVCVTLEKHGDGLSEEREIDHWAYFPSAEARATFISEAGKLGFKLRDSGDPQKAGELFMARLFRRDLPSFDDIDAVTLPLFHLAAELGGSYDGWETMVIKDS